MFGAQPVGQRTNREFKADDHCLRAIASHCPPNSYLPSLTLPCQVLPGKLFSQFLSGGSGESFSKEGEGGYG